MFQNEMIHKIVSQYFTEELYHLFLITSLDNCNSSIFEKVFQYDSNSIKSLVAFKIIKGVLDEDYENSEIFIPNIDGILDNYCFHKSVGLGMSNINFYFDGILFFYPYLHQRTNLHYKRKALGFALGIKYKFNPVIFPSDSGTIHNIYSLLPRYTKGYETREILPIQLEYRCFEASPRNETVILTADITTTKLSFFKKIVTDLLGEDPDTKILFKHHPTEVNLAIYEKIMKDLNKPYEVIEENGIIENIIETTRPKKIIGYPSTALITLKLIYQSNLQIECMFSTDMDSALIENITPILNELGIKYYFYRKGCV